MWIMEAAWPITALYFGPLALWGYYRWGRPQSHKWMEEHGDPPKKSFAATTAVFLFSWKLFGLFLYAKFVVNYVLTYVLGIAFQYYSIKPMKGLSPRQGLLAAIKADMLSLTAFQVGLYGWMAVMQLVLFPVGHLHPDSAAYWFLMQIGMILGFFTSYPVNWWLIKRGIKEPM